MTNWVRCGEQVVRKRIFCSQTATSSATTGLASPLIQISISDLCNMLGNVERNVAADSAVTSVSRGIVTRSVVKLGICHHYSGKFINLTHLLSIHHQTGQPHARRDRPRQIRQGNNRNNSAFPIRRVIVQNIFETHSLIITRESTYAVAFGVLTSASPFFTMRRHLVHSLILSFPSGVANRWVCRLGIRIR